MVIKTGVPTVNAAGSPALGQAVTETTPGEITVSSVLSNVLANFVDGALIVIDPQTGKIYAASNEVKRGELSDAVVGDMLSMNPDAGQTGRSLKFTMDTDEIDLPETASLFTAVKPAFTVESLVNRLLTMIAAKEAATPADIGKFAVVIDQVNKVIKVVKMNVPADGRADLEAVALNAGESVKVTLAPEEAPDSGALPFEGGSV